MEKTLEKEGSKRLWPWKRKSSDKTMNEKIAAAASEPATSPHSSRVFDDQQVRIPSSVVMDFQLCTRGFDIVY